MPRDWDGEGVFEGGSTFDRGSAPTGPTDNPPIIRAEDPARGVAAADLAAGRNLPPQVTDERLVAVWDAQGRPQVATVVNNRQQEHFRPPTPEEWEMLKARGQWARGGLSDAPATTQPTAQEFPWKKLVAVLGVVGAVWAWKNWDTVSGWVSALLKSRGETEVV